MFRPLALYVGLRYTRAKRRNHFISFISLASMLGIALGITVLITVLSVMNGYDYQIKTRIFGMARQVAVNTTAGAMTNWQPLEQQLLKMPGVVQIAPFIDGQGMLSNSGSVQPAMITGISPEPESTISDLPKHMIVGSFNALEPRQFGIVLGNALAASLGAIIGDKVVVITPQATVTPIGVIPRYKSFTVVGIFQVEGNMGLNSGLAFINLQDAQALFNLPQAVSGLRIKVPDLYAAPGVAASVQHRLGDNYMVTSWIDQYGDFFRAIQMEKTMMFIILVLIIAVAAFNLVSTLVMVVTDKQAEIAILRTLGASPKTIMAIFIVQGGVIGLVGTLLGLMGGVALALNVTHVVNFLQDVFHVQFIASSVYFIDFLPSQLQWSDVWHVCLVAFCLSLLATLYPAWRASRTQPAEALRYE